MTASTPSSTQKYSDEERFRRAGEDYHLPRLPVEYRFALVEDLTRRSKAFVYPDLPALARRIHRDRQGRSIQLQDRLQRIACEDESRLGVLVYTRDADRWVWRCLGWAWLDGRGWKTLRDALDELEPDLAARGATS